MYVVQFKLSKNTIKHFNLLQALGDLVLLADRQSFFSFQRFPQTGRFSMLPGLWFELPVFFHLRNDFIGSTEHMMALSCKINYNKSITRDYKPSV